MTTFEQTQGVKPQCSVWDQDSSIRSVGYPLHILVLTLHLPPLFWLQVFGVLWGHSTLSTLGFFLALDFRFLAFGFCLRSRVLQSRTSSCFLSIIPFLHFIRRFCPFSSYCPMLLSPPFPAFSSPSLLLALLPPVRLPLLRLLVLFDCPVLISSTTSSPLHFPLVLVVASLPLPLLCACFVPQSRSRDALDERCQVLISGAHRGQSGLVDFVQSNPECPFTHLPISRDTAKSVAVLACRLFSNVQPSASAGLVAW